MSHRDFRDTALSELTQLTLPPLPGTYTCTWVPTLLRYEFMEGAELGHKSE